MGSDRHSLQTFKAGDGVRSMFETLESRLLLSADNGLRAVYYDNMDFTNPVLSRVDANINFNWASGSPDARVGADTFSARWTGKIVPLYTQAYTFTTYSDDGVRLWINGKSVIDSWINQDGSIPRTGTIDLEAGKEYDLQLDYFESAGGAKVELYWQSVSQAYQAVPSSQLLLGDEGLRADYFDDGSLTATDWQFTRNEAVNFDWGYGSPAASMGPETFSVRWAGQIIPQFTEQYTFYVDRDGGSRLWVNDTLLIDNWNTPAGGEASATINLTAGQKTSIKLEYRETTGLAKTKLSWSSASTTKQVIPDTQLYPFSAPIDITAGGTYIGSWESLDPAVAAVRVNTADPVTIDHSTVRSRGTLIQAGSYVNHTKTTVLNTSGYALNPNVYGQAPGRFFGAWAYDSVILEHNYMEGTNGIYLQGALYRGTTATILYNSALNIDSRKSDGNGGYLDFEARTPKAGGATEYGHINGHFVLFNASRDMVNTEIAWNQVMNEVGKSRVEDNINMYLSSGTASSPILIHDNYIDGAYSIAPWMTGTTEDANYVYNWGYSGSGMVLGDGVGSVPADTSAFIEAYDNQVVGTRKGISVAAGHDINVHDNYLLDDGYLPDGQYAATMTSGLSIYDGYNSGGGLFYNNIASNNQVGWMQRFATTYGGSVYLRDDKMAIGAGSFKDANGVSYTGDVLPSFQWHQLKMQMDFTANSGQGAGTLYHRSDTDGDGDFTDEAWIADSVIANVNLGLSTAPLDGRNPKNWGGIRYRGDISGAAFLDDLLVTVPGSGDRLNIDFESPTYTIGQPLARDYTDNNPAGQDGWTDVGTGNFGTVVASPAGKSGSQAAAGQVHAWRAASYGFTGNETDVEVTFFTSLGVDGRNDYWLPGAVPGYTNYAIPGPLTAQMEADVFTAWQDKLATHAATLGPITPAPDIDPATRFLIDFESPTYTLGQNLVGQDGWTTSYSGPGSIVATPAPLGGTQVVQGTYNGSKLVPYNFTGDETNVQLTYFSYGSNIYAGSRVSFYNDNVAFYILSRATMRDANGVTTQGDTHPFNTWVQGRIVMDFTANSGQGAATVYTRTDVNGNGIFTDEAWVIDSVLQNVNLGLSTSPTDGRNPANWHYLRLRIDDATARADNIQVTVDSTVPQPVAKFTTTFESPTYTVDQQLVGQDGWTYVAGNGMVRAGIAGKWGGQMAEGQVNAWKAITTANRLPATGIAEVTFFGYSTDNYSGPRVSLFNDNVAFHVVPRAQLRDANGVYYYGDYHPQNTWVQERVLIDLAANGGHGAVTVYTRTDTNADGDFADEAWIVDSTLQNINLGTASIPANWNSVRLRIDGSNGKGDDIAVNYLQGATSIDQAQQLLAMSPTTSPSQPASFVAAPATTSSAIFATTTSTTTSAAAILDTTTLWNDVSDPLATTPALPA
ncbi:MAG: PA14 domain-containing protein [Phycisphaerales bacterium]